MAENRTEKSTNLLKTLGPGLLFAGAAIGGSHLVQSTRAGANYGFFLVWAVLLAHLFKYPFFEFAHRYTITTGESTVKGYRRLGRGVFAAFFLLVCLAAVLNTAAVTIITAGLLGLVLELEAKTLLLAVLVLAPIVVLLSLGRYRALDSVMKLLVLVLGVTTLICVVTLLSQKPLSWTSLASPSWSWSGTQIAFLIALMGWMPAPIDISTWSSLWILERKKQTEHEPTLHETHFDFHFGYFSTVALALCFLFLGAVLMYGSGEKFSPSGIAFAGQLVGMYVKVFGTWTFIFIALLAFVTMFSTTLATFDGYTRTLQASLKTSSEASRKTYFLILTLLVLSSLFIIAEFLGSMKALVDIATTIAFLSAPFFAYLNLKLVCLPEVKEKAPLRVWLKVLSILGLSFLLAFSVLFLVSVYAN